MSPNVKREIAIKIQFFVLSFFFRCAHEYFFFFAAIRFWNIKQVLFLVNGMELERDMRE